MAAEKPEVSIVMPCLNESATIGTCVREIKKVTKKAGLRAEVVVSDNGSTDNSVAIAKKEGARVVHEKKKGYGNAYLKGLNAAKGTYLIMADSDMTYPFARIPEFVFELRKGNEFVMGTRLKGKIMPGAMPALHHYIGNPFLTFVLNLLFNSGFSDAHCGMRGFTKKAFLEMQLKAPGMEFASEMVIRSSQLRLQKKEIPIEYFARPGESKSKLKSFSDGWRHLKFMFNLAFEKNPSAAEDYAISKKSTGADVT